MINIEKNTPEDVNEQEDFLTPGEKAEYTLRAAIAQELLQAKRDGLGKKKLARFSGVSKSDIVRLRRGDISVSLEDILHLLAVFGKTLVVVPIEETAGKNQVEQKELEEPEESEKAEEPEEPAGLEESDEQTVASAEANPQPEPAPETPETPEAPDTTTDTLSSEEEVEERTTEI